MSDARNGGEGQSTAPASPAASAAPRKKRWLVRIGIACAGVVLLGGASLGGAEYYTSRPQFCGTCHVMDPYFESWSHDKHGANFGVRCVDCHYAPGEQHTIRAKFRGLSQVASYFSGRYGSGRPRAQVSDQSCLRSGCHGGRAFDSKMLLIGEPVIEKRIINDREVELQRSPSVHFVHDRHLNPTKASEEVEKRIGEVRAQLKTALGDAKFARVEAVATSVAPSSERESMLKRLGAELGLTADTANVAMELQKLEHRRIRVDQLAGLNCSACHAYSGAKTSHIAVDHTVCFTCHFTHEEFNRDTGECLRCHEPPTRSVSVHNAGPGAPKTANVLMDHQDIVKRNVNCASCHADVLRGDATVAERECIHCHDQKVFLAEFATRTTETVRKYHEAHIKNQRAHCFDCHRAVQHGLVKEAPADAAQQGFLEPVLNNCQHCHPNHHSEQVSLLTGTGGVGIDAATPNAMVGSRLNCRACHTVSGGDQKGDDLVRATREGCVACHSDDYLKLFDQWKHEILTYQQEAEAMLTRVSAALDARKKSGGAISADTEKLLAGVRHNIELVKNGGGLHNRQFALRLLDAARRDMATIEQSLGGGNQ